MATYVLISPTSMNADYVAPYTVSASSVYTGYAFYAFDGNTSCGNNGWMSGYPPGALEWLKIDFGSQKMVNMYRIYPGNSIDYSRAPGTFKLQGSNDNSSWTDLDIRSNITGWSGGVYKEFVCNTSYGWYRYYRIAATASAGGNTISIDELKLYTDTELSTLNNVFFSLGL